MVLQPPRAATGRKGMRMTHCAFMAFGRRVPVPSFCWVVRDFSLQLVNGNGEPISSNEYLERALALQKGFSDDIEDKNRIRRLLTSFFKQRECITLVRPLVNETKLQQL